MHKNVFKKSYEDLVSLDNLLQAWQEFVKGKRFRCDVQLFERSFMDELIELHQTLSKMEYQHGNYHAFTITDPKVRIIHKASVRDRVVHRAVYRQLYPFFDKSFIFDSYSCRVGKGVYRALDRYKMFAYKITQNNRKTAWVLKCDIKKFFASIDQFVLMRILNERIQDESIGFLLREILGSFSSIQGSGRGLPLGNLTSQLFCNIYMNEFD